MAEFAEPVVLDAVVLPSIVPIPPWCVVGERPEGEPAMLPPGDDEAEPDPLPEEP